MGLLTSTTTQGQSESGSNSNEGVLHTSQSYTIRFSLVSYPGHLLWGWVLLLCKGYSQNILSPTNKVENAPREILYNNQLEYFDKN